MKSTLCTLLGMALLSSTAIAQEPVIQTPAVQPPQTNQVEILSGGVGDGSKEDIEAVQRDYSLKLVFTGDKGIYLANVNVSIRDKNGMEVVNTVTEGPFLLAKLEPGRYTVEAQTGAYNKKLSVTVTQSLKTLQMNFPVKDE
jgi:hypothetical protein